MKFRWIGLLIFFMIINSCLFVSFAQAQLPHHPIPFTANDFNKLFPLRNKFYAYEAFNQAVRELKNLDIQIEKRGSFLLRISRKNSKNGEITVVREDLGWNESWAKDKPMTKFTIRFSEFCNNANTNTNKKELAAFFAQVAQETRNGKNGDFNDGLMLLSELNSVSSYTTENKIYPAVNGKSYFGRGPLQLSYNGNYGFISDCIFGDKSILLNNPDLLTTSAVAAFKSAICFWMMPQGEKPSPHQVMTGKWIPTAADDSLGRIPGFGMVTNIINGPLECNKGEDQQNMLSRIGYYRAFLNKLKATDPNCACSCAKMKPY